MSFKGENAYLASTTPADRLVCGMPSCSCLGIAHEDDFSSFNNWQTLVCFAFAFGRTLTKAKQEAVREMKIADAEIASIPMTVSLVNPSTPVC